MFAAKGKVSVEGGIGAGVTTKKYPIPKGRDRNKRGAYGKKLKDLAGENLPWFKQIKAKGTGGGKFYSSADEGSRCPDDGWSGSLTFSPFGRIGAGVILEARAPVTWKLGTNFSWENINASVEVRGTIEFAAKAQVGLGGYADMTWYDYFD